MHSKWIIWFYTLWLMQNTVLVRYAKALSRFILFHIKVPDSSPRNSFFYTVMCNKINSRQPLTHISLNIPQFEVIISTLLVLTVLLAGWRPGDELQLSTHLHIDSESSKHEQKLRASMHTRLMPYTFKYSRLQLKGLWSDDRYLTEINCFQPN